MKKITPCLWFDDNAEAAMKFYGSIFKDLKVLSVSRYGKEGPGRPGSVMVVRFRLAGQEFIGLNGGPHFKFTEAISLSVDCKDQREVDRLWKALTKGGQPSRCAWLKDKYGLSWQIVPRALPRLLGDKDPEKAGRVMKAMLKMSKIDIKALERAHRGT
jgi:predicted 3-demethylubiquinone-9 3-methyltransferase (glyoxalase superfamily)